MFESNERQQKEATKLKSFSIETVTDIHHKNYRVLFEMNIPLNIVDLKQFNIDVKAVFSS